MTREELINKDRNELLTLLSDINLDIMYTPKEVLEILQSHNLDNGLVKYRPTESVTGHIVLNNLLKIRTIIGDAIQKNTGDLYD